MQRRLIFILAVVVMMLALVVLAWPRGPKEPVYQGKTLTQWAIAGNATRTAAEAAEVRAVFLAIGTNALPFLLNEFTRPISPWRTRVSAWSSKLPIFKIHLRTDKERIQIAGLGLRLLGTNAAPALPILMEYLNDPERGNSAKAILYAAHTAALPHLFAAFNTSNDYVARQRASEITLRARVPGPERDMINQTVRHPDPKVRAIAVEFWVGSFWGSDVNVPDLLKLANDPSPLVVQAVSNQLMRLSGFPRFPIGVAASNALLTLQTNAPPSRTP